MVHLLIKLMARNKFLLLMILILMGCSSGDKKMKHVDLFNFVKKMQAAYHLGIKPIAELLPVELKFVKETAHLSIFETGSFKINDDVSVDSVDLRLRRGENIPVIIVLEISGACVTLNDVRQVYSGLTMTDYPKGQSLDEETYYSTESDESKIHISFGFAERLPDCLRTVVLKQK